MISPEVMNHCSTAADIPLKRTRFRELLNRRWGVKMELERMKRLLNAVAVFAILSGCGGGGGGDGAPAASGTSGTSGTSDTSGTSAAAAPSAPASTATPVSAPAPASTPTPSPAAPVSINMSLSGAQEVPPNQSGAGGTGTLTLDTATRQYSATVTTTGIAGTAAHIHNGAPGVAGPILFPMTQSPAGSGTWVVSGQLTADQMNALLAGQYYVNVHSAALPNGEIRAQIVPAQATTTATADPNSAPRDVTY
ncbi:CHRD domain-containing protein [Noviherbaspirillum galbum]|uniref:CHRD domain-containing protein n=1 Tax=Noviherbaspirillum galbum TaxID=2709383 RepID=A0A6B3SZV9_9BURK|nr:CHRD domain-containing protein [Noviherbaspirillum galbum]NEX64759.1 CHRD domain-containing protein [Noviherbaspirillum galbum]